MASQDPYTAKAHEEASPEQKFQEVLRITRAATTGMLTTRSGDGRLHSRAMGPVSLILTAAAFCLTLCIMNLTVERVLQGFGRGSDLYVHRQQPVGQIRGAPH
jgi:hypothetical protein